MPEPPGPEPEPTTTTTTTKSTHLKYTYSSNSSNAASAATSTTAPHVVSPEQHLHNTKALLRLIWRLHGVALRRALTLIYAYQSCVFFQPLLLEQLTNQLVAHGGSECVAVSGEGEVAEAIAMAETGSGVAARRRWGCLSCNLKASRPPFWDRRAEEIGSMVDDGRSEPGGVRCATVRAVPGAAHWPPALSRPRRPPPTRRRPAYLAATCGAVHFAAGGLIMQGAVSGGRGVWLGAGQAVVNL